MEATALEQYAIAAKAAGSPRDQAARFISAGYVALKPMLKFHAAARYADVSEVREIMLDGTRGSAKSHAIIAQVGIDDCQRAPGIKVLFLRQTQRAASESFEDLIGRVLRGTKHEANTERIRFPNGSRILIGGYNSDSDIDKYIGVEYDVIVIEEATQISGDKLERLLGSLRTSRDDWKPRAYLSTNPGGIGHAYYKERYIMPHREKRETFTRRFFSSYKDNPFINVDYKVYLEGLTGDLAKAWRDGDWDVFAGQAIKFNRARHVIQPQEIPDYWTRKSGYDWGFAKPFSYTWGARNPDNGRWIIYRNLHQAGVTDPRQVELVKQAEDPRIEKIVRRFADPSIFTPRTQTDQPTSTADVFQAHGIYLTRATNDRMLGKRKIDTLLENMADGFPGLLVFENCTDIIRTLPSLVYSRVHPEDVDTEGDDHDYDGIRYMFTDDITQEAQQRKQPARPAPIQRLRGLVN